MGSHVFSGKNRPATKTAWLSKTGVEIEFVDVRFQFREGLDPTSAPHSDPDAKAHPSRNPASDSPIGCRLNVPCERRRIALMAATCLKVPSTRSAVAFQIVFARSEHRGLNQYNCRRVQRHIGTGAPAASVALMLVSSSCPCSDTDPLCSATASAFSSRPSSPLRFAAMRECGSVRVKRQMLGNSGKAHKK
jgi:hypothetical protein